MNLLGWNALFVMFLVLTILPHQIDFPATPDAYPFESPDVSPLGVVFLILMLVISPVLFIDFMLFARQISLGKPSLSQMGKRDCRSATRKANRFYFCFPGNHSD